MCETWCVYVCPCTKNAAVKVPSKHCDSLDGGPAQGLWCVLPGDSVASHTGDNRIMKSLAVPALKATPQTPLCSFLDYYSLNESFSL